MTNITGKSQLTERISKKVKLTKSEIDSVITNFLEETQKSLLKGEDISFKNYFTLKRSKQAPKISKLCDSHTKKMNDYKATNKGKGLAAFAKSPVFRKLSLETRSCNSCKAQKQKIAKSTKLLTRVVCKASD